MNNQKKRDFTPVNHQIRSPKIYCIDHNDVNLGEISTKDALTMAIAQGLDLVQVSGGKDRLPTCRILDYGKYKYQQSKNQKAAAKKQRENSINVREIKFRPSTDVNDLRTKASKAEEFLEGGDNVKVSVVFHGREMSHKELAHDTLNQFLSFIPSAQVMGKAGISGRSLEVTITKKASDKVLNKAS